MASCLVTGGSGFIGSNLALRLQELGHQVTVLDNLHSSNMSNLTGFQGVFKDCDVSQPFAPPFAIEEKTDFVFHQAAITDPRYGNDAELFEKNVSGFRSMINLCKKTGARLIYASTAGLYGNGPVPMKESQPKETLTVYGQSKLRMDEISQAMFGDLPVIGLRYFNVFGPREAHKGRPASMILHLYLQMKAGKRPRVFKFGEHLRDFIYVKDVVEANLCAMTSPSGIFNVGTGIGTSFNELIAVLNDVMGLELAAEYFDMPYDPATYQSNTQADVGLAKSKLNFTALWSLRDAVADYIQWMEQAKR